MDTAKSKRERTQKEIDEKKAQLNEQISAARENVSAKQKEWGDATAVLSKLNKQLIELDYKMMPGSLIELCETFHETELEPLIDEAVKKCGSSDFEWGGNERVRDSKEFIKYIMQGIKAKISKLESWYAEFQEEYDPD